MADISNIKELAKKLNLYNIAKCKEDLKVKFKNNLLQTLIVCLFAKKVLQQSRYIIETSLNHYFLK